VSDTWLDIIGIGEDGMEGLSPQARKTLQDAEIIIGGDRHHALSADVSGDRIAWPSPFDAMIDRIKSYRGKRIVVLVTGDPLWYSVGARITKGIPASEVRFFPQLSAFQWAACRMGWSLADCETVTVHGRSDTQILPYLAPGVRMLVLAQNADTPAALAALLTNRGFGGSKMTALAHLGGVGEQIFEAHAEDWSHGVPDFHTVAIQCIAGEDAVWYPRTGGLPDGAFEHDGQMTKRVLRAATICALAPYPDALLWDVGAGCGSVAIEWMRASRGAQAIAVEPNDERGDMIRRNMISLGAERLKIVDATAPDALYELPKPDAIFIGGGLTDEGVFETCWQALRPMGRLVANAVTLESESRLQELHASYGGELTRIGVSNVQPVGRYRGWRSAMPVTQWAVVKP